MRFAFVRFILFSLFILFFIGPWPSQSIFYRDDSVKVFDGTRQLLNPWAGGLNATLFSSIDLNFDGKKDLIAFDKESFKVRCFLNTGAPGQVLYLHAPQFEAAFPEVSDWIVLADYNGDGKEDIFTYTTAGCRIFKNTSPSNGPLQFSLMYPLVYSDYNPGGNPNLLNLYCSSIGFPAITDIDNDGDLDILNFSVFGTTLQLHQNNRIELGLPSDSVRYELKDVCWGDFAENTCSTTLNYCPTFLQWKKALQPETGSNLQSMHAGSCLTCFDGDGDGDKDLLLGDISCDSMEYYYNTGSVQDAHVDSATKKFPSSLPVKMSYFPCSYYEDTNNDGARDLIVSPLSSASAENFTSTWLYKNTGTDLNPIFSFLENNFLQDSMLDFGTGAYPALTDENGDGLIDIFVGNYGYFQSPTYQSRLALLRNTGSVQQPQFTLVTRNYGNLGSFNIQNMSPAFGDLDGDGDQDMLVGDFNGTLTSFQNSAGSGSPINLNFVTANWNNIDVGNNAMPQIIDVDRDGLKDLLVGGRNGKIFFFKNTGTSSVPVFSSTPTNNFFGGVNVCKPLYITGFAAPHLRDVDGNYELLVGSERGYLYRFGNIDGNINGTFTLIDSIGWNIWEGGKIAPVTADFNGDDIADMILGNLDGGINFFKGDSLMSGIAQNLLDEKILIFPNPASDFFTIRFTEKNFCERKIICHDLTGKNIFEIKTHEPVLEIPVQKLDNGVYLIRSEEKNKFYNRKLIIQK